MAEGWNKIVNILFNEVLAENEKFGFYFCLKTKRTSWRTQYLCIHIVYMYFHTHTPSKLLGKVKEGRMSSIQMKAGNRKTKETHIVEQVLLLINSRITDMMSVITIKKHQRDNQETQTSFRAVSAS